MRKIKLEVVVKEFPFEYRPQCSAVEWMEMIKWCVANCSAHEAVANQTSFRFKSEACGRRFFDAFNGRGVTF